jgi:hypothetical protein
MQEETIPTTHEKISIFVGAGLPDDDMTLWLDRLLLALKSIVLDYSPSTALLTRVINNPSVNLRETSVNSVVK